MNFSRDKSAAYRWAVSKSRTVGEESLAILIGGGHWVFIDLVRSPVLIAYYFRSSNEVRLILTLSHVMSKSKYLCIACQIQKLIHAVQVRFSTVAVEFVRDVGDEYKW